MTLPPPTRSEPLIEVLHGEGVSDPYRWLEDEASAETRAWIAAQNAHTQAALDHLPGRDALRARLDVLLATGSVGVPTARGTRYFYTRRDGRQDQPVLWLREGRAGPERALLDPNRLSTAALVALDWWYPSRDGHLLAYGLSEGGDEWSTLRVQDVASGADLPGEEIPRTRHCSLAWLPDDSGFYYTRYPLPGTVPAGEEDYHRRVFFHRLGTDWRDDPLVFGKGRAPQDSPHVDLSPDGRWLTVTVSQGWSRSEVYLLDRARPDAAWVALFEGIDAWASGGVVDDRMYLWTNQDAPRYRVLAFDAAQPARAGWREVLPEPAEGTLGQGRLIAGLLASEVLHNATSELRLYAPDGAPRHTVALPRLGSLAGIRGEWASDEMLIGFTSFVQPTTAYRVDAASGALEVFAEQPLPPGVDPADYTVQQVWYPSRDGTRVSMFLVHRADLIPDGNRPTLLSGYGGFNVNNTPAFNATLPVWLDAGGVYAVPNLRGGGEYGETWHQAGMLAHKQNTFDDFLAAAEWLIAARYTRPARLAISGGSNGGLLVGAALTQRPELFQAVVCRVPLLDMVRYHRFLMARYWIAEYGSAEDPEAFRWLYAYSPYHRVQDGTHYPAVLLLGAANDGRVDPLHARKMAARLQAATASDRPILLRQEADAGHGIGKPRHKVLAEQTDVWGFLGWQLGVEFGQA